jgi:ABC-type branched-subunit amino acid transport system ATPase component
VRAVSEVSLTLSSGLVFSIIGPNGAGKTTLLNLISGIYAPQDGLVRLGSEDVTGLAPHLLARRGLSRTFQNLQTIASSASRCRSIRVTGSLQSSSSISRAQYHCKCRAGRRAPDHRHDLVLFDRPRRRRKDRRFCPA